MPPSIGADLTPDQRDLLDMIRTTQAARGFPPTTAELARARGVRPSAVREMLAALQRKRVLRLVPYVVKSIIVLESTE